MFMSDPENTERKQAVTLFKPGQSGNPRGRPKGSRNKINEAFLRDFYEAWEAFGRPALMATAWTDPAAFVKVAAALLPKEFKIETSVMDMTDEQLQQRIRSLAAALGDEIGAVAGVREPSGREEAQTTAH